MSARLQTLTENLTRHLQDRLIKSTQALGEVSVEIAAADLQSVALSLRDLPEFRFEILIDLCGVDYSQYGERSRTGSRYAVVYHLLSIRNNHRLRVRVFASDDEFPVVDSVGEIWPAANWYEREAFDFYGIVFTDHPDLRRILTDYGFIGHPFRKDFPLSGHVEMRYDPEQRRVIYQPVTIEPREIVPRVVREEHYGDAAQEP